MFDTIGDNLLAVFASAVDAVNCAVELQRKLAEFIFCGTMDKTFIRYQSKTVNKIEKLCHLLECTIFKFLID